MPHLGSLRPLLQANTAAYGARRDYLGPANGFGCPRATDALGLCAGVLEQHPEMAASGPCWPCAVLRSFRRSANRAPQGLVANFRGML
jgi:hypothetical protein